MSFKINITDKTLNICSGDELEQRDSNSVIVFIKNDEEDQEEYDDAIYNEELDEFVREYEIDGKDTSINCYYTKEIIDDSTEDNNIDE